MSASKAALHFEARKIALTHDKNGIVLKLAIHPEEFPADLMATALGSRFMVAMVQIGDDEQPVPPKKKTEIEKIMAVAHTLPRNQRFQQWMVKKGFAKGTGEEAAIEGLYEVLGLTSRAELASNQEARVLFMEMRDEFEFDMRNGQI